MMKRVVLTKRRVRLLNFYKIMRVLVFINKIENIIIIIKLIISLNKINKLAISNKSH
jgi:hypothetical protein